MGHNLPETKDHSLTGTDQDTDEPAMYKVLLHNDDYTTMEFVVDILVAVFRKSAEEATRIMFNVHKLGVGMCGLYTREVAETKVETVIRLARQHGHPLRCTMEKA
jgi:ATP-dependent Clp protease adaptor protein ClpS